MVKKFFVKIDQNVLKIIFKFLSFPLFLKIKNKFSVNFNFLMGKIENVFRLKLPNLHKLIKDTLFLYTENKWFILHSIRVYFYITIIVYVISFFLISLIIGLQIESLQFVGIAVLQIYRFWTFPIKKIRRSIKYLFIFPFEILQFIIKTIKIFCNFFKKNFADGSDEHPKRNDFIKNKK